MRTRVYYINCMFYTFDILIELTLAEIPILVKIRCEIQREAVLFCGSILRYYKTRSDKIHIRTVFLHYPLIATSRTVCTQARYFNRKWRI